ncbi:MAG: helix-turn-helix domain-containing protein [bacterium]|jgi:transcriptional regulator with XRE-family HTH domain|nr:helix-turn-helix domain-containing protein [Phycisphaerales bacterium]MCE2654557.1 helix-turn-helix domain-containing protein [Planctomycetaceae bacterium]
MPAFSGAEIKRKRVAADLTQTQLAGKLGVSQAQVSIWETGKAAVPPEHLPLLQQLFGDDSIGTDNPFGDWLRRQREDQNLTVQELADKAGLTPPTIYNIEAGRIAAPRQGTKDRLAAALNVPIPADVQELVRAESDIAGLGTWQEFEPHDPKQLPVVAGVYVLYDRTNRPVYVGQSINIESRIKDHRQKKWFIEEFISTASYIEVVDDTLRKQIEMLLIKFMKTNALLNERGVDRGESDR